MIALMTPTGQTIRVAEERVEDWEARGYVRADQPATESKRPAKKAVAKKAPAKKAAASKKSSK